MKSPRRPLLPATRTLLALVLAAGSLRVLAQDAGSAPAADGGAGRLSVKVDSPASAEIGLERTGGDERTVYDVSIEVPGRLIPLTAKIPLEAGQTGTTLSLSVKAHESQTAATIALHREAPDAIPAPPALRLGVFSSKTTTVSLDRADASAPASYTVDTPDADPEGFAISPATLSFAAGQKSASFTIQPLRTRTDAVMVRVANAADPSDRLRLLLPVRRSPLAAFENNFYVCFIKKIPFGTREIRETAADGTVKVRTETVYKGRWHYITNGLRITIEVALCAVLLGAVLGFIAAVIRTTHDKHGHFALLDAICKVYITVIRGTPMTVQLLIAYFIIFSNLNNKILVAILAFGFNSGAYVAEIIRAGITSIDDGQMEAARALGLSYGQGMRKIVLPQAIRNILPALGNEFIVMLKDTSIASFIGLDDLARGGSIIRSQTYQAYIPFLAVALIYLILVMIFSKLLGKLERRLHNNGRGA